MKQGNVYVCNVCSAKSNEDKERVFIKAHKDGESVHICLACLPMLILGAGKLKSNHKLESEFFNEFKNH